MITPTLPRFLHWLIPIGLALALLLAAASALGRAAELERVDVEGQPLAANAERLLEALNILGAKPDEATVKSLQEAIKNRKADKIQEALDPLVLVQVTINPESRVKARRGPAEAKLQQGGHVPALIKVVNDSTVKKPLHVTSPQAGKVYNDKNSQGRFLVAEMFTSPPLTANLSGLRVEYALALIYSHEAGKREATLTFDVGQGTQDQGFRAEVPILFDVKPGVKVKLSITDVDGKPTVGRFTFRDKQGHIYPPQAKRLAPDFFFQEQVYRPDGGTVLLPPGDFTMHYGRGPEY
ncbi:MAG TPA: hypothetical protein VGZ25_06525, partial [Gemmataceae bacterium]|nr:hypothetical protein [Gemmataceae bacterium]